ncbi:MAG: hypothetical protein IIB72_01675 [Proteobacteria bacterium]|nr:hypothetical protein [Pseudomonadota bacterium]
MSADAVVFEELLTELDEKLEQGATNRVVGELAAIAARIQINLQTLTQEERDRILGLLLEDRGLLGQRSEQLFHTHRGQSGGGIELAG